MAFFLVTEMIIYRIDSLGFLFLIFQEITMPPKSKKKTPIAQLVCSRSCTMSGSNQASFAVKTPLNQSIVTKNKIPTILTLSSSISGSTYASSLSAISNRSINH